MKKWMYGGAAICLCTMLICMIVNQKYDSSVILALAITFGTFFYHLAMRLAVGGVINAIKRNRFDYTMPWFQERAFEKNFYKAIRIKSWKISVPTFTPDVFDITKHTLEEVIMATCQAEVVHEVIVVLSFIPILFSLLFGEWLAFVLTSVVAAGVDMIFVLLQRFNRPRLLKMMQQSKRRIS